MALTKIKTGGIAQDNIADIHYADTSVQQGHLDNECINEAKIQISNSGTNGQFLQKQSGNTGGLTWADAGGAGSIADDSITEVKLDIHADPSGTDKFLAYTANGMEWAVPTDTNTQLSTEQVQDIVGAMFTGNTETNITATYEDSDGTIDLVSTDTNTQLSTEEVQDIVGAMFTGNTETGITVTYEDSDGTIDLAVGSSVPTAITVADESSDTTCFPLFATAATGDLGPKTGDNLTFNSSTGELEADIIKDSKGNLRSIPQNNQGSSYTLVAADAGKCITTAGGVTVDQSIFASGDAVTIVNDSGSDITITQGSNVTIYNASDAATGNRTLASRGMASMWFSAHNYAYISGAGLS